jgi:hypothetical protein
MMFGSIAMYNSTAERWPGTFSIEKHELELSTNRYCYDRGSDVLDVAVAAKSGKQ